MASLCGVYDIHIELLIGTLAAVDALIAWFVESLPRKKEFQGLAWAIFLIGCASYLIIWLVIWYYFFLGVSHFPCSKVFILLNLF